MRNGRYNGKCGFIRVFRSFLTLKPVRLNRSNVLNTEVREFIGLSQKRDETD